MHDTILEVKNINKNFTGLKVVDDISFEVYKGEIMGLLGPNGAGKTTVIRMLMDIFQPDSGMIKYNTEYISGNKMIGYLPEERGIYDETKVIDTILYFADLKGMDIEKARESALKWLDLLKLKDFANNKIEDLSKGMQQKVQFIISIIHSPRFVIFDEVFSGLDPVNQDLFKEIILNIAQKGTTILLSSHRMTMVEELCDRIFMINKGKRVLYGELGKIKDEFGEKKVRIVAGGNTDFLRGNNLITNLKIDEDIISFNLPLKIKPVDFLESLSGKLDIDEISILKPPLHEIFIREVERREKE